MLNKIYEKIKKLIVENYKQLLTIIVIILLFSIKLPFVIYAPGGTIDLEDRIKITDEYEKKGQIKMSYVSVMKANIPFLILSYCLPNWDLDSAEDITYEGDSVEETFEKDKVTMQESIDNATIAAYTLAGKEIEIKEQKNIVLYITKEAQTDILEYDEIVSVEGQKVASLEEMRKVVNKYQKGDNLNILVLRNGEKVLTKAKVYKTDDGLKVGISLATNYKYKTNPSIKITTKHSESGPSGGLMIALSIYNKLVKEDLTQGKIIVGTGTIDKEGKIGEIGGVKYKLMGAVKDKADIFICPEENYHEAKKIAQEKNYTIKIIKVKTLEEAIKTLENL